MCVSLLCMLFKKILRLKKRYSWEIVTDFHLICSVRLNMPKVLRENMRGNKKNTICRIQMYGGQDDEDWKREVGIKTKIGVDREAFNDKKRLDLEMVWRSVKWCVWSVLFYLCVRREVWRYYWRRFNVSRRKVEKIRVDGMTNEEDRSRIHQT